MSTLRSFLVLPLLAAAVFAADGDESPRALIEAAVQAHGGAAAIDKTLCGNILSKANVAPAPGLEAKVEWEENYEVGRRYRRKVSGEGAGKKLEMEFAITEKSGWIRQDGKVRDYPPDGAPAARHWSTVLFNLTGCLAEGVKLRSTGAETIDGRTAKKVESHGEAMPGETTLLIDEKTNRLVQIRRRLPHPVTRKATETLYKLGDFKNVDGVVYPHRLEIVMEGKTLFDVEILRIEFARTLDDKLFARPE